MENGSFSPKRVLVVDDEVLICERVAKTLEQQGFEVFRANSGTLAQSMIELAPHQYDLVITDVRMPGMDGIALLKYLRHLGSKTKFIVMSGYTNVSVQELRRLGVDEFLYKPFSSASVLEAVAKV